MSVFQVESPFWEVFPQAKIGVVIAKNITNNYDNIECYQEMLDHAQKESLRYLDNEILSKNEVISIWREAYKRFKTKKGARSSIEALLKRASKGNRISTINPLVDIYNSCSLKYGLPNGGEDIDKFVGDVKLTLANGGEDFITLGSEKSEPPYEGEVIYKDNDGAICRCWNWREAVRTMITNSTQNAFLCIETLDIKREDSFYEALSYLSDSISEKLGGECKIYVLDKDNTSTQF